MSEGTSDANVEASEPVVHGALMGGFAQACVNLNIVAGRRANMTRPTRGFPASTSGAGSRCRSGSSSSAWSASRTQTSSRSASSSGSR